jgi:hypothetical protein
MQKNIKIIFIVIISLCGLSFFNYSDAIELAEKLKGRILLQVQKNGEAWYVNPADLNRYYLGRPDDAFEIMRKLGIGISNTNLEKIQMANITAGGEDVNGDGKIILDKNFATKQSGKIFLQVERNGEAWYLNPVDLKRYYLGRPSDAFAVMRSLGLGISNLDLEKIPINQLVTLSFLGQMENGVHLKVNEQRVLNGLKPVKWNSELAVVARKHSLSLAKENVPLIDIQIACSLPIIHHENLDLDFGLHNFDRLESSQIYYFNATAENIALTPALKSAKYEVPAGVQVGEIADCESFFNTRTEDFKSRINAEENDDQKIQIIKDELIYRENLVVAQPKIILKEIIKNSLNEIEDIAVIGWMNSPGHRQNILTAEYDEAGVGIAEVEGYYIMTQVFITRIDCGYKDSNCCYKDSTHVYCYQPYNCVQMKCLN